MRRMIPSKFEEWIKKIFKHVVQNGDTTEVGGDLEVDGKVKVNGKKDFTDKDGNPIDFGGGGGGAEIIDSEDIVADETEEGVELYIQQSVKNKITNSLQLPQVAPLADSLVGVGTNGSQKQIGVGDGLAIDNNVAKVVNRVKVITPPSSTTLTEELINIFKEGIFINGSFLGLVNPVFYPAKTSQYGGYAGIVIDGDYMYGYLINSSNVISLRTSNDLNFEISAINNLISLKASQGVRIFNAKVFSGFTLFDKVFPQFPNDTTKDYTLKYVNGSLVWVEDTQQ